MYIQNNLYSFLLVWFYLCDAIYRTFLKLSLLENVKYHLSMKKTPFRIFTLIKRGIIYIAQYSNIFLLLLKASVLDTI